MSIGTWVRNTVARRFLRGATVYGYPYVLRWRVGTPPRQGRAVEVGYRRFRAEVQWIPTGDIFPGRPWYRLRWTWGGLYIWDRYCKGGFTLHYADGLIGAQAGWRTSQSGVRIAAGPRLTPRPMPTRGDGAHV